MSGNRIRTGDTDGGKGSGKNISFRQVTAHPDYGGETTKDQTKNGFNGSGDATLWALRLSQWQ